MSDSFEYVVNYKITKYAVLFILSNGVYQMLFQDGSEIHIIRKNEGKKVIYIDIKREKVVFDGKQIDDPNVIKRLEHVQESIKKIKER